MKTVTSAIIISSKCSFQWLGCSSPTLFSSRDFTIKQTVLQRLLKHKYFNEKVIIQYCVQSRRDTLCQLPWHFLVVKCLDLRIDAGGFIFLLLTDRCLAIIVTIFSPCLSKDSWPQPNDHGALTIKEPAQGEKNYLQRLSSSTAWNGHGTICRPTMHRGPAQ